MTLFLQEVEQVYPDAFVVIFMDQAGWYRSKDLVVPENIKLFYIPPYSPELNPWEMVWKTLRKNFFHNVYFQSLEAVENRLYDALSHYTQHRKTLLSACSFDWVVSPILNET